MSQYGSSKKINPSSIEGSERLESEAVHSAERFTPCVEYYDKFRPNYPPEIVKFIAEAAGIGPGDPVADVGAGTGIFTQKLLDAGFEVYAVEPNQAMRAASVLRFQNGESVFSIDGSAENTNLENGQVKLVTCAQSFHWFDPIIAKKEFSRICQSGSRAALIWNKRKTDGSRFSREYEKLLNDFCPEYKKTGAFDVERDMGITNFFSDEGFEHKTFYNDQQLDFEGLKGRLLSSSYCIRPGHPKFDEMINRLRGIFERRNFNGIIKVKYNTHVFIGKME